MRELLVTLLLAVPAWCLAADPDRGLVGGWNFDEVSGIVVHDGSGLGNDGTLFGDPQRVRGRVGQALAFGPSDRVEVEAHPRLNLRQRFSIEFWIRPAAQAAQAQFLVKGPVPEGWDVWYEPPGKLNFRIGGLSGVDHVCGPLLKSDQWNHVVWTYDGTLSDKSLTLYVNGESKQTWNHSGSVKTNDKPLTVGNGVTLDELRLYDRTLSAVEVARHFSSPKSLATSEVFVAKVWPRKLRYHPREKVEIEAAVASLAQQPRQVRAKVFLEHGIDDRISLLDRGFELAPGETKDFAIQWAPEEREFGFDVVVELTDPTGRLLDRKSETFLVGKNAYQLSQESGMALLGWDDDAVRRARDHIITARRNYLTITEVMALNPDNFSKCVPDTDKWFAGQGSSQYRNSKAAADALVQTGRRHGVAVVAYEMSTVSGFYGTRFATEHPEWMAYTSRGRFAGGVETQTLAWTRNFYRSYPASLNDQKLIERIMKPDFGAGLQMVLANLAIPEAVQFHAGQVLAGMKYFGWDGLRWDGHPQVGGPGDPVSMGLPKTYDVNGNPIAPDPAVRDRLSERNVKMIKQMIWKQLPDAVFGYNWGLEYAKHGKVRPLDYAECCRDGGMILWESINNFHDPSSPWHRWKDAADAIADEVEYPRKHGGFLNIGWFPWWLAGEVYGKHLLSVTFAARARISGTPGLPSNLPYFRFAARYGRLLYDERVCRAPDWRRRIRVEPSDTWWENYVYQCDSSAGRQLIVHLVNPPATEQVIIDGKQAPETRKDRLVRLTPPDGQRPKAVYVLSPDRKPYCQKLTYEPRGQELQVHIPELKYWDLLVFVF
jgi:hypothetical protein